jgi:hypothetical protein
VIGHGQRALTLAEQQRTSVSRLFPGLGRVRCDCCGRVEVDEVGLILVEEALVCYRDAVQAKREQDRHAWEEAFRLAEDAQRAARAARGA